METKPFTVECYLCYRPMEVYKSNKTGRYCHQKCSDRVIATLVKQHEVMHESNKNRPL